jgi:hypothetical protein
VLGSDGNLWREFGNYTDRKEVDANVSSFRALDQTTVFVEGADGNLWRELGNYTNRS